MLMCPISPKRGRYATGSLARYPKRHVGDIVLGVLVLTSVPLMIWLALGREVVRVGYVPVTKRPSLETEEKHQREAQASPWWPPWAFWRRDA